MINLIEENVYYGRLLSVFSDNLSLPRHRWYGFKEGFSSNLVSEAIRESNSKGSKLNILDPFVGSGTTIVSAGQLNHNGIGIEVNPFLVFASKAKITGGKWNKRSFDKELNCILHHSRYEIVSPLENYSTFSERKDLSKWLFNTSVIRGFNAKDQAISNILEYYLQFRLALFAGLMDCCNARRDGKCLRYKKNWETLGYNSNSLQEAFLRHVNKIAFDIENFPFSTDGLTIYQSDSRNKIDNIESDSIDLVVTSPPYLNSFDYSDVYRPELFLGGFVRNNDELKNIRLKTIRSHVQVKRDFTNEVVSPLIAPIIKELSGKTLWNRYIIQMITSYFVDMSQIFRKLFRVVRRNGSVWFVVSTSAYSGIEIPVDLILADIATQYGWHLHGVFVLRNLRSAGQQHMNLYSSKKQPLRESLIILKK